MLKFLVVDDLPELCHTIRDCLQDEFRADIDCTVSASEGARKITETPIILLSLISCCRISTVLHWQVSRQTRTSLSS